MRILHLTCRVLAYVTGGAILAVVCSPLLLVGLACLALLLVLVAIAFGLALGLAAVCASIFESLVGLPFWLGMCLTGTGAVLMTIGLLVNVFKDGDESRAPLPKGSRSSFSTLLALLAGLWIGEQLSEGECGKGDDYSTTF
ncbi:MAG: hypothetical protein QME76_10780 [Bacillota bacterium]|nr:hypothetical protein [Bacillota bacterium]